MMIKMMPETTGLIFVLIVCIFFLLFHGENG
jgi:hypothetical protein